MAFSVFEPKFNDQELEKEFTNFFYKYNLTPLFTNEHRAGTISVSYVEAKSVINAGGSYHKTLMDFSDLLNMAQSNKSYEEALFKIIHDARSFQGMMKTIKNLMKYMKTIDQDIKYNMWNIVFYNKDVY